MVRRIVSAAVLLFCFSGMYPALAAQGAAVPQIDLNSMAPELRKQLVEPPHLGCVSQDYEGPLQTARYVNRCPQPLHLTIVFGNTDDVREINLAPGKSRNFNLTLLDYNQRKGSSWYVCPKGYSAVDPRGTAFKRPIDVYLCRQTGH